MDDNDIKLDQDEYHFSEMPETPTYTSEPYTTQKRSGLINRRNFLILIGLIIVALSLYKLFEIFSVGTLFRSRPISPPAQVTQLQPQVIQPAPSPVTTPTQESTLNDQLTAIQNQTIQNKAQIDAMQTQLSSLANSLATVQSN